MNINEFIQKLKTHKRKCPICGNIRGQKLSSFDIDDFDDSLFSGKVVLFGCENCGFVFNDETFLHILQLALVKLKAKPAE